MPLIALNHILYLGAVVVVSIGMVYVFYPALLVLFAGSIPTREEVVSSYKNGNPPPNQNTLLSIVIPAYNEEDRLPRMLSSAIDYMKGHRKAVLDTCRAIGAARGENFTTQDTGVEWLVVSDGSTDGTANVAKQFGKENAASSLDVWKLIVLEHNSGKGAAVKTGMIRASGQVCLMVDADGATEFGPGLEALLESLLRHYESTSGNNQNIKSKGAAAFGSRAYLEESSQVAKRSLVRNFLMYGFQFCVRILCSSSVKDTQCGFKAFTRDATVTLFGNLHLRKWAFDTELVVLAERQGIPITEVAVPWHEVDGSKLDTSKLSLALISLSMLRDMICVRTCYTFGIWQIKK